MTDPADAAERAVSEPEPNPNPSNAGSGTGEESIDVLARMLDGSLPGPTIDELCADYDLSRGQAMVLRGVIRPAPGSGMPPVADILLGIVMIVSGWYDQEEQQTTEPNAADQIPHA